MDALQRLYVLILMSLQACCSRITYVISRITYRKQTLCAQASKLTLDWQCIAACRGPTVEAGSTTSWAGPPVATWPCGLAPCRAASSSPLVSAALMAVFCNGNTWPWTPASHLTLGLAKIVAFMPKGGLHTRRRWASELSETADR